MVMKSLRRRALRTQAASLIFPYSVPAGAVRFAQTVSGSGQPGSTEKTDQNESNTGEMKSSSGGYAKRSDEEGYGAEYGGKQSLSKEDEDKIVHGNAPEYEKSKKSSN